MTKLLGILIIFLVLSSGIYAESMTDGSTTMNVIPSSNAHMSDGVTELTVISISSAGMTDGVQNIFIGFQPFPSNYSAPVTIDSASGAFGNPFVDLQTVQLVPTPEVIGVSSLTFIMLILLLLILVELFILFIVKRRNRPVLRLR